MRKKKNKGVEGHSEENCAEQRSTSSLFKRGRGKKSQICLWRDPLFLVQCFMLRRAFLNLRYMATKIPLRQHPIQRAELPMPIGIQLTEREAGICDLLNQCTNHLRQDKNISTTCRIAGGWVRDKVSSRLGARFLNNTDVLPCSSLAMPAMTLTLRLAI